MLKEEFFSVMGSYSSDLPRIEKMWEGIGACYSRKGRYYHTLEHLSNMLAQLAGIDCRLHNRDAVVFALYYHDIVYSATRSDNEEKSAARAATELAAMGVPGAVIEKCKEHILATKKHIISTDSDTNFFTDADLSILGAEWESYKTYYEQIRKEYAIYPDILYNPGRKKVLGHFLEMESIFKTQYFRDKLESAARKNLQKELLILSDG